MRKRVLRRLLASIPAAYLLLLCFPQLLFAHQLSYRNLTVYSRAPLDSRIYGVLDRVESRLAASEIKENVTPRIFLTDGFGTYALLSLYIGTSSFGKSYAALPPTTSSSTRPTSRRTGCSGARRRRPNAV